MPFFSGEFSSSANIIYVDFKENFKEFFNGISYLNEQNEEHNKQSYMR